MLCLVASECFMMDNSLISAINPMAQFDEPSMSLKYKDIIDYFKYSKALFNDDEPLENQQKILKIINACGLSYFEKTLNETREKIKNAINPIYDAENILKVLYDGACTHDAKITSEIFFEIIGNNMFTTSAEYLNNEVY